jgi:hypothetical protein
LPNSSPTMTSSGLSMSPSNISQLSCLSGPLTPHASQSSNDVAVIIAVGTSRSNSTTTSDIDLLERSTLNSNKMYPSPPSSTDTRRRTDGSSAVGSDYDRSSFEVQSLSTEVTPKAKETPSLQLVSLQQSPVPYQHNSYAEHNHHHNTDEFLHSTQNSHVHRNGCCSEADIRCSVADDVLAAWGDLGGWQDLERFRMCT